MNAPTSPIKPTGCCDPFDPTPWEDKEIQWHDQLFVQDHVTSFLHMPLNMGKKITQAMELIKQAGAASDEHIMLTDEKSLWGSDIYIMVKKAVPGAHTTTLSGTFITKVFEGPFQQAGQWAQAMEQWVKTKNRSLKKIYFYYTTCPKCAKVYGKNYVVLFAHVE